MTTAVKTREVTFLAPRLRNLLVTIEPDRNRNITDGAGNLVAAPIEKGVHAQFDNWTFTTDDPQIIEALRTHAMFVSGADPGLQEAVRKGTKRGFYEAYDASRPKLEERLAEVAELAVEGDSEGLEALVADEESFGDGGREQVLSSARATLDKLDEQRAIIADIDSGAEAAGASQTENPDEPEEPDGDGSAGN